MLAGGNALLGPDLRLICGFYFSGQSLLPYYHWRFKINSMSAVINYIVFQFLCTDQGVTSYCVFSQLAMKTVLFPIPINAINIYMVTQARNLAVTTDASLYEAHNQNFYWASLLNRTQPSCPCLSAATNLVLASLSLTGTTAIICYLDSMPGDIHHNQGDHLKSNHIPLILKTSGNFLNWKQNLNLLAQLKRPPALWPCSPPHRTLWVPSASCSPVTWLRLPSVPQAGCALSTLRALNALLAGPLPFLQVWA